MGLGTNHSRQNFATKEPCQVLCKDLEENARDQEDITAKDGNLAADPVNDDIRNEAATNEA